MVDWPQERRQVPRASVRGGHVYLRSTWTTVQLLDISLGGVLVSAPRPFEVGRHAGLRAVLDGERVAADVEIRREDLASASGQAGSWRCAAAFVAVDEKSRRALEKFLRHRISKE